MICRNIRYNNIAAEILSGLTQRWRLVAILAAQRKPVAMATNDLRKTHPIMGKGNSHIKLHAEIHCLLKAPPTQVRGSTMYVWRMNATGFAMAKPCSVCQRIMREFGVKKVIYSTEHGGFQTFKL